MPSAGWRPGYNHSRLHTDNIAISSAGPMTAYLEHFKLSEPPFRIAPDAVPFFSGAGLGTTLESARSALTSGTRGIQITGTSGSGKTTLCHTLATSLRNHTASLLLSAEALTSHKLLTTLGDLLNTSIQGTEVAALRRTIQEALLARQATDKSILLLIDDAHAASDEILEEIQTLAGLDIRTESAIQIVLSGRPTLQERLDEASWQPLRERLTSRFTLKPFNREDVGAYLEWRLKQAGHATPGLFSGPAIDLLASASEGRIRPITVLADKALQAAAMAKKQQVDANDVRVAIQDTRTVATPATLGRKQQTKIWAAIAAGVGVIVLAALSGRLWHPESATPKPAAIQPAQSPETAPLKPLQPHVRTTKIRFGPLTRQHMTQFDKWIDEAPGTHYFIQLLATDATKTGQIEGFVAKATEELDPAQIRAYRSNLSGHDRVGVIYGDFATREEAVAAMQQLPDTIKAAQPFPRQVARLR
jgi:type II secretory pathway predicted ATPase ExeA